MHRDCHVQHERALYLVPFALVGKRLWLRASDGAVAIYEDYRWVTPPPPPHPRGRKPGARHTVLAHLPPTAQAFFSQDRHWCLEQARAVGSTCAQLFTTCASLTATLNAARATHSYERRLAAFARVPLLIVDDFGLKPLCPPADEDLHDLLAERYETTAIIVTRNLDFSE